MWHRVVESVGKDVTEVAKGDTVIPIFLPDCGECIDCKSTKSNCCTNFPFKVSPWMPRHESTRFTDLNGEIIYHFMFVSSFSEYTVVDIANITKIDPQIPPDRACLLSCGISTIYSIYSSCLIWIILFKLRFKITFYVIALIWFFKLTLYYRNVL
jgi:S-(hydroxymethyl)glutathione dehydrogenase/alcohol dehydrogenase